MDNAPTAATGANPFVTVADVASGGFTQVAVTATVTLSGTSDIRANITTVPSAGLDITLPAASGKAGQIITVADTVGTEPTTGYLRIKAAGSDLIDGFSQHSFYGPFCSVTLQSDGGTKWTVSESVGIQGMDVRSVRTPWGWFDAGRGTTVSGAQSPFNCTAWKNMGSGVPDLAAGGSAGPYFLARTNNTRPAMFYGGAGFNQVMNSNAPAFTWSSVGATFFMVLNRNWATNTTHESFFGIQTNATATKGIVCSTVDTTHTWLSGYWIVAGDLQWAGNGFTPATSLTTVISKHSVGQVNNSNTVDYQSPTDAETHVVSSTLGTGGNEARMDGLYMTNGIATDTTAINTSGWGGAPGGLSVGSWITNGQNCFTGLLYEIMIFDAVLTSAQQIAVSQMLMAKYGIGG
jgi:hypothetical protein